MRRFPVISILAIALAAGAGFFVLRSGAELAGGPAPAVPQVDPAPGGPPVVWVAGTLREVRDSDITIQKGEGASIQLQRLAPGASRFLRLKEGRWREITEEETDRIQEGEQACAEVLLDGDTFVALRVFLGALGCGPV